MSGGEEEEEEEVEGSGGEEVEGRERGPPGFVYDMGVLCPRVELVQARSWHVRERSCQHAPLHPCGLTPRHRRAPSAFCGLVSGPGSGVVALTAPRPSTPTFALGSV